MIGSLLHLYNDGLILGLQRTVLAYNMLRSILGERFKRDMRKFGDNKYWPVRFPVDLHISVQYINNNDDDVHGM